MTSYPASCDCMVARPPNYQESIAQCIHTRAPRGKKTLTRSGPHNRLIKPIRVIDPNIVTKPNKENTQNSYYLSHPRNTRQRLCNIL